MKTFFNTVSKTTRKYVLSHNLEDKLRALITFNELMPDVFKNNSVSKTISKDIDQLKGIFVNEAFQKSEKFLKENAWRKLANHCKLFLKNIDSFDIQSDEEKKHISKIYTFLGIGLAHGTHEDSLEAKKCFETALELDKNNELAKVKKEDLSSELGEKGFLYEEEVQDDIGKKL